MDQETSTHNSAKPPTAPQPVNSPVPENSTNQTDTMGIISLVCAFIGMQLIGFIVGLIGASKAKKGGRSATLSTIGWVLNLIFGIIYAGIIIAIVISGFKGAQEKAKQASAETKSMNSSLLQQANSTKIFNKGETAKFGDLEVKVSNITRNYVPESKYSQAEAGKELIVIDVTVKNVGDSSKYIAKYDFDVDVDGLLEAPSYVKSPGTELPGGSLATNASVSGQMVFEVPAGKSGINLAYKDYVTDPKTYKSQEVIYKLAL